MTKPHIVIIGGGLAGLSAGCYARANGLPVTLIEHNLSLGGVCTAWTRAPYTIDGCIHWLTGGPFERLYRELGIVPAVELRVLEHFATYRDVRSGQSIRVLRDLDELAQVLKTLSPADKDELTLLVAGARRVARIEPNLKRPHELLGLREMLTTLWSQRKFFHELLHYRKPLHTYVQEHLSSELLRRFFVSMFPPDAPAVFALMVLGYLELGYLSRPVGGTARFRDALVRRFQELGGEARVHATADEVIVHDGRAAGVRLSDGTTVQGDCVISTSSMPETILRLLGGRYELETMMRRFDEWELFEPIVLVSYGVERSFAGVPSTLYIDRIEPFDSGGRQMDHLYLRVYNDDPSFAPPGHTVLQAMLATSYEYWVTRNADYHTAKDALSERVLAAIERHLPGTREGVRMVDVATPLTYWGMARSWRGAYEGWKPNSDSLFAHIDKRVRGLSGFYMAGQWVEPGGGVPAAVLSGRQVIQLICADQAQAFLLP